MVVKTDKVRGVNHALELKFGYAGENSDETYVGLSADDFKKTPFLRYYCSHDTREKGHCQISANDLRMNSVSVSVTALSTVVSTMIEDESTWSPPIFFAMT